MPSGDLMRPVGLCLGVLLTLVGCGVGQDRAAPPAATVTVTASPEPTPAEVSGVPETSESPAATEPEPAAQDDPAPASYAEALGRIQAGDLTQRTLAAWQSPSGNIHCLLDDNGFDGSCEVLQGRIDPPDPGVCAGAAGETTVGRVEILTGAVTAVCNTDTIVNVDAPVLEYGAVARTEGFITCVSEETGMTCVNTDLRRGFFLARGTYTIFGE